MPQLNPSPWFIIFLLTWSSFLIFIVPKIMMHHFPYPPSSKETRFSKSKSWSWPWY